MMKWFKNLKFIIISLTIVISPLGMTQDGNLDGLVNDTKNDFLVVVGGGLAGAILGLSTLSFVEEPKEHTRNILVGASIGIIAGVGYVAFSQATRTQDMIYSEGQGASYKANIKEFGTTARSSWHGENIARTAPELELSVFQLGYSTQF